MIEIIPAIDIIDGKCVRLEKGEYNRKKVYSKDPVETAKMFESWGVRRLHLVDLDGARAQHIINHKVLYRISRETSLIIDFGGGIKSNTDIETAFGNGAHMVTCGSIAVKKPEKVIEWIHKYGPDKLILGADHRKGIIAVGGWLEESNLNLMTLTEHYYKAGLRKIISTDIDKDGMLEGPSFEYYRELLNRFTDIYLIASGGVSDIQDVARLEESGLQAVIIGKAIYEKRITEKDLIKYL